MKKLLSITAGVLAAFTMSAQCPQISCPSNITVNNDPGTCGAVVNYATPVGTNPCGAGADTFNYTGSVQTFVAPQTGLYSLDVRGAKGGDITSYQVQTSGLGGRATGDINLTVGQTIYIYVGGAGEDRLGNHPYPGCTVAAGGWNGGGETQSAGNSAPGGGASDIRVGGQTLNDRVIVAGGAGGCGWQYSKGGDGGGLTGSNGTSLNNTGTGAMGGTQLAGGAFGSTSDCSCPGKTAGVLGVGGSGRGCSAGGGGGGGGYYGGGGGGYGDGGGGGSSYIGGVLNGNTTAGYQNGNGEVIISWTGGTAVTTQTSGLPDGGTFPVGVTTNWYKVEDGLGNKDSCSFTVTVVDNEAPSISCPNDTTICWGIYNATIATSDNCPNETVAQIAGPTLGSSFDVGTYTLEFVVTDASGNKDTCNYNVTVEVCGGVNENNSKYGISVYPNPMKEYVIIENKNIEGSYTIEITNTLGAIVKTVTSNSKRLEITKGEMSKGMYYYSIKQNNQTLSSGKLAVE
jgi:hypothetical protein